MLQDFSLQLYRKKKPAQTFLCEYCEIFNNVSLEENLWTDVETNFSSIYFSSIYCKISVLINVSQHSQENTCARASPLINIVAGLQFGLFSLKYATALLFFWHTWLIASSQKKFHFLSVSNGLISVLSVFQ